MSRAKTTILFVDDDQSIRDVFPLHLRAAGFEVDVAEDEEQACAAIDGRGSAAYDVVVTDMRMPSGDKAGLTVLRKALAVDLTTQVIVLTGFADLTQAVEAMQMGAFNYMAKGEGTGESAALVEQVKKALDFRKAASELLLARHLGPAAQDIQKRLDDIIRAATDALGQATVIVDAYRLATGQLPKD